MTCWTLCCSIGLPSMMWRVAKQLVCTSTSLMMMSGVSCASCALHWRFVVCSRFGIPTLTHVLQVFKDATLFFSHSMPNLVTVIPVMDHIDKMLTTYLLNSTSSPSISAALSIGNKMLNHYHNKTDHSKVYWIAMSKYIYTLFCQVDHIWCLHSSSPPAQAQILWVHGLGTWVDCCCERQHSSWIRQFIYTTWRCWGGREWQWQWEGRWG